MPTTQIVNFTSRQVRGQTTLADATGAVVKPCIAIPLLPLNGSFGIRGRIQACSSDGTGSQSVEIDIAGNVAAGASTNSAAAQVLTPALAGVFANIIVAITGATQQLEITLKNGAAAEAVTLFWSWDLVVERTLVM